MHLDYSSMTVTDLVDLLSQKTQIFTQLLINKKFEREYKECKEAIQQIIAEMESRKEAAITKPEPYTQPSGTN